jgi:hypothetical protein
MMVAVQRFESAAGRIAQGVDAPGSLEVAMTDQIQAKTQFSAQTGILRVADDMWRALMDLQAAARAAERASALLRGRPSWEPALPPIAGDRTNGPDEPPDDWRSDLLAVLGRLPPPAFERLCQQALRKAGFIRVEVSGCSGDGGIDGAGVMRVGLLSFLVLFQCKRWKGSVGPSVVRDFRGAMSGRTDKGLILTTAPSRPRPGGKPPATGRR